MKFYIAGGWGNREQVREAAQMLIAAGLEQTHDWTREEETYPDGITTPEAARECADADIAGVAAADVVVMLQPGARRGTHIELGAALGLGKPVVLWSPTWLELDEQAMFYWSSGVTRCIGDLDMLVGAVVAVSTKTTLIGGGPKMGEFFTTSDLEATKHLSRKLNARAFAVVCTICRLEGRKEPGHVEDVRLGVHTDTVRCWDDGYGQGENDDPIIFPGSFLRSNEWCDAYAEGLRAEAERRVAEAKVAAEEERKERQEFERLLRKYGTSVLGPAQGKAPRAGSDADFPGCVTVPFAERLLVCVGPGEEASTSLGAIRSITEVKDVAVVFQEARKRHRTDLFDGYRVETDRYTFYVMIDNTRQCCEEWGYLASEDDFNYFIGAELRDVRATDEALRPRRFREAVDICRDEGHIQFVDLVTSKGVVQLAVYSTNGHYGHHVVLLRKDHNGETVQLLDTNA